MSSILTPAQRRRRNREEVTAGILEAARAVMREHGVAALNLQEVARRVGMRAPSLYEYFASKAALYDALFLLGTRLYAERASSVAWDPARPWESIREAIHGYVRFAQEYPELYGLVFERQVPGFSPSPASMEEAGRLLGGGSGKFRTAMDLGTIVPGTTPEAAFDLLIALMHGLASQHLANDPGEPADAGRFGSLIPVAVAVLRAAWEPKAQGELIMASVGVPQIHHVALTVNDVNVSVPWYEKVFGISYRMDVPHPGGEGKLLADDGGRLVLVLHRHEANPRGSFSERQAGLDHVGFVVSSRADLEAWQEHLARLGVEQVATADRPCTQSPISDAPYAAVLVFRDPDNIQLELFAPPSG